MERSFIENIFSKLLGVVKGDAEITSQHKRHPALRWKILDRKRYFGNTVSGDDCMPQEIELCILLTLNKRIKESGIITEEEYKKMEEKILRARLN